MTMFVPVIVGVTVILGVAVPVAMPARVVVTVGVIMVVAVAGVVVATGIGLLVAHIVQDARWSRLRHLDDSNPDAIAMASPLDAPHGHLAT